MTRFVLVNGRVADLKQNKILNELELLQLLNRFEFVNQKLTDFVEQERELLHLPKQSNYRDHLKAIKELALMRN